METPLVYAKINLKTHKRLFCSEFYQINLNNDHDHDISDNHLKFAIILPPINLAAAALPYYPNNFWTFSL